MSGSRFKFSVVVPIYQVEAYLAEAIESVLAQSVGFEENIELILVNDGSMDDSESVCLSFQSRYPDNITYVRQQHAGVSVARNNGMSRARGEYVNFLDGDDRWATDAFEKAWDFIAVHPGIEVVAARMHFFGALDSPHPLDHKFHENRVVDIVRDPAHPQLSGVSTFIRRGALVGHSFDPRLTVSQDFRFIAAMILEAGRYGLLGTATYWYRRRADHSSSISRSKQLRTWYLDTPRFCYRELFELSKRDFGLVLPYIQHCVMYDLQWRLRAEISDVLTSDDMSEYKQLIVGLLREIDDTVIMQQKHLFAEYKLYALALKHGTTPEELRRELTVDRGRVEWRGLVVSSMKRPRLVVEVLRHADDALLIEGYVNSVFAPEDVGVVLEGRGQHVAAATVDRPDLWVHSLGEVIHRPVGFSASIPLGERVDARARLRLKGSDVAPRLFFGPRAGLTTMEASYVRDGEYTIYLTGGRIAARRRAGAMWHLKREVRYLAEMIRRRSSLRELTGRILAANHRRRIR